MRTPTACVPLIPIKAFPLIACVVIQLTDWEIARLWQNARALYDECQSCVCVPDARFASWIWQEPSWRLSDHDWETRSRLPLSCPKSRIVAALPPLVVQNKGLFFFCAFKLVWSWGLLCAADCRLGDGCLHGCSVFTIVKLRTLYLSCLNHA